MLGIIPWAFIIHILLIISDSIWMISVIDTQQKYVKERLRSFYFLLISEDIKINDPSQGYYRFAYLNNINELSDKISKNNQFYDGIKKINFSQSQVSYLENMSTD